MKTCSEQAEKTFKFIYEHEENNLDMGTCGMEGV